MEQNHNILLIGANFRATFYVARKLLEQNYIVDLIGNENIPFEKSTYINSYYYINSLQGDTFFKKELISIISEKKYEYLIPINDLGVLICKNNYHEIQKHVPIIMSNLTSQEFAYDKYKLALLSNNVNLGNTNSILINSQEQLLKHINTISKFPIIAKSCNSKKVIENQVESYCVFKALSTQELISRFTNANEFPILLQDFIQGEEYGFNFIAKNGEIQSFYFDKPYLSTFGTESIARQYVKMAPIDVEKIKMLVKIINWDGIGMFDIIVKQGKTYIIELNSRFWASIDLCEKTHSNLWYLYSQNYLMHTANDSSNKQKENVVLINLLSATKTIINDIKNVNINKLDIKIILCIIKSFFSANFFIQENILKNFRFYMYYLFVSFTKKARK